MANSEADIDEGEEMEKPKKKKKKTLDVKKAANGNSHDKTAKLKTKGKAEKKEKSEKKEKAERNEIGIRVGTMQDAMFKLFQAGKYNKDQILDKLMEKFDDKNREAVGNSLAIQIRRMGRDATDRGIACTIKADEKGKISVEMGTPQGYKIKRKAKAAEGDEPDEDLEETEEDDEDLEDEDDDEEEEKPKKKAKGKVKTKKTKKAAKEEEAEEEL